jgi:hypothetical protein
MSFHRKDMFAKNKNCKRNRKSICSTRTRRFQGLEESGDYDLKNIEQRCWEYWQLNSALERGFGFEKKL